MCSLLCNKPDLFNTESRTASDNVHSTSLPAAQHGQYTAVDVTAAEMSQPWAMLTDQSCCWDTFKAQLVGAGSAAAVFTSTTFFLGKGH